MCERDNVTLSFCALVMGHGVFGDVTLATDVNNDVTTRRLHQWLQTAFPNALGYPGTSKYTRPFHATLLYIGDDPIDSNTITCFENAINLDQTFHATVKGFKAVGDESSGLIIMSLDCPLMVGAMKDAYDAWETLSGEKPDATFHGGYVMGLSPHVTIAFYASQKDASDDLKRFYARSPNYGGGQLACNNFRVE